MHWRLVGLVCLAAPFASIGCGRSSDGNPAVATVVDSAGIEVITHPGPLVGEPLEVTELWTHGFSEGDYLFESVFSGALAEDGGAVVGESRGGEVVRIDPGGNVFRLLAENGQGPSEVGRVRMVRRDRDGGFWVEDSGNWRVSHFRDDHVVESVDSRQGRLFYFMHIGMGSEGELLMRTAAFSPQFEEEWLEGHLIRVDPSAGVPDTVGAFEMVRRQTDEGLNPLAPEGVVAVADGRFVSARQDLAELSWRSSGGSLEQVMRWTAEPEYPTAQTGEEIAVRMAEAFARMNRGMSEADLERHLAREAGRWEVDESVSLPLFGQIYGAPNGDVWIADFRPWTYESDEFLVVSSTGLVAKEVLFERPITLLDVMGNLVLGLVKDEVGVIGVAVYQIAG